MYVCMYVCECIVCMLLNYPLNIACLLCRFEYYNSKVREQNIFSNRRAPSRDIAKHFAILQHIRAITDGGCYGDSEK